MKILIGAAIVLALGAGFFLFAAPHTVVLNSGADTKNSSSSQTVSQNILSVPEAISPSSSLKILAPQSVSTDIENQAPLSSPPEVVKAIYLTGWSAGSESKLASSIDLIQKRGLNAMVIDVKDYSGYVAYRMDVPGVKATGAENEVRISKPNTVIKKLHDKNIYVIGRVTVFQDPILAKAHPEWAFKNKATGKLWTDNHGLAWLDPAGNPTWDYVISIAKDALSRGFDEINFDYIRFASDGSLSSISYPFWDQKMSRHAVIKKFFGYLREHLPNAKISADLFGLATIDTWDDLGIGQVIEDAYHYFDYISPMVYPSHYAPGTLGYKNPAQHPYEIIHYSLEHALSRLNTYENATSSVSFSRPKLRPWLQAFDLGAVYTPAMIDAQIKAATDVLENASATGKFGGWLLWDPSNNYYSYRR